MSATSAADLLYRTADLIETKGHWRPGGFSGMLARDSHCVMSAMNAVDRQHTFMTPAIDALREIKIVGIANWSDFTPTADVLATLREVAWELERATEATPAAEAVLAPV